MISVASTSIGTVATDSVTITAPTGIQTGDVLVSIIQVNNNSYNVSPPAGFTTYSEFDDSDGKSRTTVLYKTAVLADESTVSYAYGVASGLVQGIMYRLTDASSSFQITGTSVTPDGSVSLAIIIGAAGDNDSDCVNFGSYSLIGGENPTFTERVDQCTTGSTTRSSMGVADAVYSSSAAISSFNVTAGGGADGYVNRLLLVRQIQRPIVSTEAVDEIAFSQAQANGTVTSDEGFVITERGFVWSTTTTPTVADSSVTVSGTTGAYSGTMTGLVASTLYYVRAYATNSVGTTYGDQVTFTTSGVPDDTLYKDINAEDGSTYAIRMYVGGTTGTITVSLGSTGYSEQFAAGAGYVTLQGEYEGLNGITITSSATFDGYIDDFMYVLVVGTAAIDWDLDNLTNIFPINSSVLFRRLEDENFDRFRIIRYIDVKFKDLEAYVTVELKKEANEGLTESTKEFLVGNATGEVLPFLNKKISTLSKSQAIRLGFSNARLSETFTICQFIVSGIENPRGTFDGGNIISMS